METPTHQPTPAELMLPNPHMDTVIDAPELNPEVEQTHIAAVNAEQTALKEGADPSALPLYGNAIRYAREARLRTTDQLTGLLSREGLNKWFERYKPEKFAIFFCDGDNFGQINKQYGHQTGDEV